MRVINYENLDDMMRDLKAAREQADASVKPWQAEIKVGDFFYRCLEKVTIYGEIKSPMEYWEAKGILTDADAKVRLSGEDYQEYRWERERAEAASHSRHCRAYSSMCPEGELGSVHVSSITGLMTKQGFELMRVAGWPYCELIEATGTEETS